MSKTKCTETAYSLSSRRRDEDDIAYLAGGLSVESQHVPELVLGGGGGFVDLVTEDQHWAVAELLVRQQRVQLRLWGAADTRS